MARRKITEGDELTADLAAELPELTAQQLEFVEGLLAGKTASDAYRAAYDCAGSSSRTIWANACRLRNDGKVSAWLAAARQAYLGHAVLSLEGHLRELERLRELALAAGNIGAAVQAEQLRGKASGHYVEQFADVTCDPVRTLNEIAELSPELAAALAKQHGIAWAPAGEPETKH